MDAVKVPVPKVAVYVHYHPPFPRDRGGRLVIAWAKMVNATWADAFALRVMMWPLVDHVIVDAGTGHVEDVSYYTREGQAS
jgi:hypothetical protein